MLNDKLLTAMTAALFSVGLGLFGYVFYKNFSSGRSSAQLETTGCVSGTLSKIMEDEYMEGMLDKGDSYQVLKDYYNCNGVKRGELVWFRISAPIPPVVRIVAGLPGDRFEVVKDTKNEKRWLIKVNGEWIKTKNGDFFIETDHTPPLKTYEISRKGVLRDGEYILFSNKAPSLSDSSNLGLIRKRSIEGKVVKGS